MNTMVIKGLEEKEIIKLMRDIKRNQPNEFIKLIGAMEVLKDKEVKYIEPTVEELILKLLEIQESTVNKEMMLNKKNIIEIVLNSSNISAIKCINAFSKGVTDKIGKKEIY